MSESKIFRKYLDHYAEKELSWLKALLGDPFGVVGISAYKSYQHCLVIPAFNENLEDIVRIISKNYDSSAILFILILNTPLIETTRSKTSEQYSLLDEYFNIIKKNGNKIKLSEVNQCSDILIINKTLKEGIKAKQGVGCARKIGNDMACYLKARGVIASDFIHNTDADVTLPLNYFKCSNKISKGKYSAIIYPYQHTSPANEKLKQSIILYEKKLKYYVNSLQAVGSPYAFETIGSTLAISFHAYVNVRGFPKRSAGEDFYMLNKLRKTNEIYKLKDGKIFIKTRLSDRVPFGTGPALKKIIHGGLAKAKIFYAPQCFDYLKALYRLLPLFAKNKYTSYLDVENVFNNNEQILDWNIFCEACAFVKLNRALTHAATHSREQTGYICQFNQYFDAFICLKWVHYLRDYYFPSIDEKTLQTRGNFFKDD